YLAGEVSINYNNGKPTWAAKNATKEITVKGNFNVGEAYYVSVLPSEHHTFTVRINGYLSKKSTIDSKVTRSAIMDMATLPAPEPSSWTIVGEHNSWDPSTGIILYNDINGAVAKNVSGGSEFKLVKDKEEWYSTMIPAGKKGTWCKLHLNRVNMKPASGSVDIWVNEEGTACGVVDQNAAMPTTYQYHVVLQHNWDWANRRLYSWIVSSESKLMGEWSGASPSGTFEHDNNEYSYWEIPTRANNVKIGVIFSNNGADQTQDSFIDPLDTDKCYWLEYRAGKGNFSVEM
ncbi:MAG: hypothetical protein IJ421_10985, partial [Prevotella sp.]|nr:hypothetical protein [Prevotella sp.]